MSDTNTVFDPAMYSFHEVADGIALDDFIITKDMPTCKGVPGRRLLATLEIPDMLDGADYAYCPADGVVADRYETVCNCAEGAVADVIYKKNPEITGI